ncbi:InlB B-repeat-containing protein [Dehalococcoidia bacterium]|nr:InlB B-repeat-containing protein [Dehalococcoidia bacterium]
MRRKKLSVIIILVAVFALIFPGMAGALPPPAPHRFHGAVTVNGTAAFDGTVIVARVNGEERAQTKTVAGKYGYAPLFLEVHGDADETIHFYVDGIRAIQEATLTPGDITRLDLTAVAQRHTLTVVIDPTEGGAVPLDPPQPAEGYIKRTPVTLTATPATGYTFERWSGHAVGTEPTITITMVDEKRVTAHFAAIRYTLTEAVDPPESGTVTLSPEQPPDGYTHGTVVILTAVPKSGYAFHEWSGDVTGTANPITLTMDAAKSVTAHFAAVAPPPAPLPPPPVRYTLAVTIEPDGSGIVQLTPPQPAAGYVTGTVVTLAATAAAGYTFDRWSGDAAGTDRSITLTMDAAKGVTAHFRATLLDPVRLALDAVWGQLGASVWLFQDGKWYERPADDDKFALIPKEYRLTELVSGGAYWIYLTEPITDVVLGGVKRTLDPGWHNIGWWDAEIAVPEPVTVRSGLEPVWDALAMSVWAFKDGRWYERPLCDAKFAMIPEEQRFDMLEPGWAYWINLTEPVKVVLGGLNRTLEAGWHNIGW